MAFYRTYGIIEQRRGCCPGPLVLCQPVTVPDTHGADAKGLEPLLSIDDVARLLSVWESGVYRLVRSGELARVKVGGRTLFEPKAVRAFVAGCREVGLSVPGQHRTANTRDSAP